MYGCRGSRNTSVGGPFLHDASRVHHREPVAHLGQDREVVGDEQHRQARARPAAASGAAGPAPAPSRRARSSARRRSPGPGWHASAIAIITRCFCPPENSCGKSRDASRRQADALQQLARAQQRLAPRGPGPCARIGSAIWSPTRITGSSACCAPWKMIDPCVQRIAPSSVRLHRQHVLAVQRDASRASACRAAAAASGRDRSSTSRSRTRRPDPTPGHARSSGRRREPPARDRHCVWYSIVRSRTSSRLIAGATSGSRSPRSRCRTS